MLIYKALDILSIEASRIKLKKSKICRPATQTKYLTIYTSPYFHCSMGAVKLPSH